MSAIIDFVRGSVLLRITGAWPEGCLNRYAQQHVAFWDTNREDDFTYTVRVYQKDFERANRLAGRAMCECEIIAEFGLHARFGRLRYKTLLIVLTAFVLAALCILPQFVWTIEVEGCEMLHEQQIIRALESIGIGIGTWGPSIESQNVKNHMLTLLPELEWIAINRSGGRATVLVSERTQTPEIINRRQAGNIVASQTGIITQISVLSGEPVVAVGQTVLQGELLVSGYFDRTTGVQVTHAMAEIYARTWHQEIAVTPTVKLEKVYTGTTKTKYALVLGKNRINLFRNSGIWGDNYDKITQMSTLTLPGGFTLPISLITETWSEYTLAECEIDPARVETRLNTFTKNYVFSSLIGGEITQIKADFYEQNGLYCYDCIAECTEQIAQEKPNDPNEG